MLDPGWFVCDLALGPIDQPHPIRGTVILGLGRGGVQGSATVIQGCTVILGLGVRVRVMITQGHGYIRTRPRHSYIA